jgi:hypothetical protein
MKSTARGLCVLLLAFGIVFATAACSVSTRVSKISKADVAKLNAANANVETPFDEIAWESSRCPSRFDAPSKNKKCEAALVKRYIAAQKAAAAVYDEVASRAPGECQKALRRMAYDIRGNAEFLSGGPNWVTEKEQKKDRDAMLEACKLKLEKSKT